MTKTLKKWNGRAHGSNSQQKHFNVVAYSQKQAAELLSKGSGGRTISTSEIKNYYSPCWGTRMNELVPTPTTPCLYVTDYRTGDILEMYM